MKHGIPELEDGDGTFFGMDVAGDQNAADGITIIGIPREGFLSPDEAPGADKASSSRRSWRHGFLAVLWVVFGAGCTSPIGVEEVTARQAYAQLDESALRSGRPSAETMAVLHRFDLDRLASRRPEEAVRPLHEAILAAGEQDLLFALAELSYAAGDHLRRSANPRKARDPRDFYLGAAVYAWLFLFGAGERPPPSAFDPLIRRACEYYNHGLGLAFAERSATNAVVEWEGGLRRMPVGDLQVQLDSTRLGARSEEFAGFFSADRFRVRGLSVRNRGAGLGAPLVAVRRFDPDLGVRPCSPATLLLRVNGSLGDMDAGNLSGSLELYSPIEEATVEIHGNRIPLESDLTTPMAYALNPASVWGLGKLHFRTPGELKRNQLVPQGFFRRGRIPVVLVHGTFSSPVTWAELNNTLAGDPVLRQRLQVWNFMYGSGNPLAVSAADLRDELLAAVRQIDPEGGDSSLRQMVVIGHSQGGLLTKLTATRTDDFLWREISETPLESLELSEDRRAALRRLFVVEPVPYVRRVVFISTPHRGSYLASHLARKLANRLVSLPATVVAQAKEALSFSKDVDTERFLGGRIPTSLDSMSPRNPVLLALAKRPIAPGVFAHSIIPIRGDGDFREGRDGLVTYESAHLDGVESECVVRGRHSCQNLPATIEEVRRILHAHLKLVDSEAREGGGQRDPSSASGTWTQAATLESEAVR